MDTQATFLATLIDEWVRCGVTDAVVAPGNRSTLMSALMLRDGRLKVHVMVDERSASFFALGLGMATGRPAVMWCTSGTAPAELHASVIEANQANVPLLICTADRPPELQHARDWQTVDQSRLYEGATRWSFAPGVADNAMRGSWRSIAARSVAETTSHPMGPGPVHLNLGIREPWSADVGELPEGRPNGAPWHTVAPSKLIDLDAVKALSRFAGKRGVIVVGQCGVSPYEVWEAARRLGWPVIAEARSGVRGPSENVIGASDDILRKASWADAHRPEVVLRLGTPVISKTVTQWLKSAKAEEWLVDPYDNWVGPSVDATHIVRADPTLLCELLASDVAPSDSQWISDWRSAETVAQQALSDELDTLSEPALARTLVASMVEDGNLFAATSMPVRDVEWYSAPQSNVRIFANRGASGMDGLISSAAGVASATGAPTALLTGDLTFLYDLNALWVLKGAAEPINLIVVVVDNNGGGIFSMLPQLSWMSDKDFERVVGTPQDVDIPAVATALGVPVHCPTTLEEVVLSLRQSLDAGGLQLIYVKSDRQQNALIHKRIHEAVVSALP